jgi:hypothetical protein
VNGNFQRPQRTQRMLMSFTYMPAYSVNARRLKRLKIHSRCRCQALEQSRP